MRGEAHKKLTKQILAILRKTFSCLVWQNETGCVKRRDAYYHYGFPGSPDIIGCVNGHFIGLEVKTGKGKQNSNQKRFEHELAKTGGHYRVVRNVEEAVVFMEEVKRAG